VSCAPTLPRADAFALLIAATNARAKWTNNIIVLGGQVDYAGHNIARPAGKFTSENSKKAWLTCELEKRSEQWSKEGQK
jgi:hypothetical protein